MTVTYKREGGKTFASIKIDGDDTFVALVSGALTKIYEYEGKEAAEQQSLRPGKKMLKAINESGNVLTIRKGGSFTCTGSGDELIHAYYMTTGSRLYNEGSTLDELLTAGMPPFHYREITENRFRVLKSATTPVRQYYKVGTVAPLTVCAHCGKEQPIMARGGAKATKCEQCGKSLPYDDV